MTIGISPDYNERIEFEELTQRELLVLLIESVKNIDWEISYLSSTEIVANTNKGMLSWNADVKITIENNTVNVKSSSTGNETSDLDKKKECVQELMEEFNELKIRFTKEDIAAKFIEIEGQLATEEVSVKLPPQTTKQKIKNFFSLFIPVEGYFITPILINLNIFIFVLMVLTGVDFMLPTTEDLINWGANFRPVTLDGGWLRLLTNCFLHIGVFHLLLNMYALMYIGQLLEPHLGKVKFLAAYLLTGLLASVTSLWWHDFTVSAGASGAIFGMYGVFLLLLTTKLIDEDARKKLLLSISIFIGYNLIGGMKEGIDNAAHIGGLIGGLVIGFAYTFDLDKKVEEEEEEENEEDGQNLKFKIVGSLTVFCLVVSFIICNSLTNSGIGIYNTRMQEFNDMEKMALEVYSRANYEPKEDLLYDIKDRGIYYWKENILLIDELDKLDLPDIIHERNSILKKYCQLRIESYELIYKAVSEDTDKYKKDIQNYDRQIEAMVNSLTTNN